MRSRLSAAVRTGFRLRMDQNLPSFRHSRESPTPSECDLFVCSSAPKLTLFLLLQVSSREEAFTIELGWSASGEYPLIGAFTTGLVEASRLAQLEEVRFRLPSLWSAEDYWWKVSNAPKWLPLLGRTNVEAQVNRAWGRLVTLGVSCFRATAEKKGVLLPF